MISLSPLYAEERTDLIESIRQAQKETEYLFEFYMLARPSKPANAENHND